MCMAKVTTIMLAYIGTHEELELVANALESVKEFKESGDDALPIFDDAGSK